VVYKIIPGLMLIQHTEVPPVLEGAARSEAYTRRTRIRTQQGAASGPRVFLYRFFMAKHPEYNDLLPRRDECIRGVVQSTAEPGRPHSSRSLAYLALIGGILCIAWSAIFVRWTDIPGPASAFYRLLIPRWCWRRPGCWIEKRNE